MKNCHSEGCHPWVGPLVITTVLPCNVYRIRALRTHQDRVVHYVKGLIRNTFRIVDPFLNATQAQEYTVVTPELLTLGRELQVPLDFYTTPNAPAPSTVGEHAARMIDILRTTHDLARQHLKTYEESETRVNDPLRLEKPSQVGDSYQFAYNAKYSTLDAVSCLTHAINSHLDKGCKSFKAVFLDFSNAFNILPRQGLLEKFSATNPPYNLVKWVHNYFTGRSQCIRAHDQVSITIPNYCGVLQGAVLSPFFFTLHNSDLFFDSLVSFPRYADDVVNGHPCRDAQGLCIINNALKYVSEWSGQNGLNLNLNKSVQCAFSLKRMLVPTLI